MISENNIIKERRSSRGDPDQIGGLHPNIPSAADFQTHQTFPRVPAAGEHQLERHCGPSIFWPQMETMRASAQELIIWVYCFAMFVVIFGSTVYYAERCPVPAQLTADSWQYPCSGWRRIPATSSSPSPTPCGGRSSPCVPWVRWIQKWVLFASCRGLDLDLYLRLIYLNIYVLAQYHR